MRHAKLIVCLIKLTLFLGFHSAMISHAPSYQDMLMKWLSEAGYGEKYWVPCYRAHVNGWQKLVFHRMCDNRGPSVTIARIDSFVFGGFSDKSWRSEQQFISHFVSMLVN